MLAENEAVSSQILLCPAIRARRLGTRPFFHVSRPQRLSPFASIPAINRITDGDSVTVFAKLYLFSSVHICPKAFYDVFRSGSERSYEHRHASHSTASPWILASEIPKSVATSERRIGSRQSLSIRGFFCFDGPFRRVVGCNSINVAKTSRPNPAIFDLHPQLKSSQDKPLAKPSGFPLPRTDNLLEGSVLWTKSFCRPCPLCA